MIENIIKKDNYKSFSQLLFFENRLNDEVANYIAISSKYLFRRDGARLISWELEKEHERTFHYPIINLETEGCDGVQLKDRQNLSLTKDKEETVLEPIDVPYLTNALKILSKEDFSFTVKVESKSLVRSLLAIQRKVLNQSIELDQVILAFDFIQKIISVDLPDGKFETLLKGEFGNSKELGVVYYSYPLFKDFFQNSNSFNKEIILSVNFPYYTVIQYTDKIKGILTHQKSNQN